MQVLQANSHSASTAASSTATISAVEKAPQSASTKTTVTTTSCLSPIIVKAGNDTSSTVKTRRRVRFADDDDNNSFTAATVQASNVAFKSSPRRKMNRGRGGTRASSMKRDDPVLINFLEQFFYTIAPKASEASVHEFIDAVEQVNNAEDMQRLAQELKFDLRDDIINAEELVLQANPGKRPKIFLRNTKKAMKRRRLLQEWRSTINKLKGPLRRVGEGRLHNGTLPDAFQLLARKLTKVWAATEKKRAALEKKRAAVRAAEEAANKEMRAVVREAVLAMRDLSNGSISTCSGDDQGNVIVENLAAVNGSDSNDMESDGDSFARS